MATKFTGAHIKEQGVEFAIIVVQEHILNNSSRADKVITSSRPMFPGIPIILMAQDSRGVPKYYGRRDVVNFMASVPMEAVPWQEYTYG